ncbi:acyl-CoA carboxylase subunit epsilon [Rothia sp. CCM 9418]|uniref:acyl-CoA carboxylase subunit epsilon n=1 Tax=Rothia sp. CCM 9418 TaxID=3402661 RepID=UPI003AEBD5E0
MASSSLRFAFSLGSRRSSEQQESHAEVEQEPLFSVVSGNPTEEELAALSTVLLAMVQSHQEQQKPSMGQWQRRLLRGQTLGVRLRPGPGSWRRARPM